VSTVVAEVHYGGKMRRVRHSVEKTLTELMALYVRPLLGAAGRDTPLRAILLCRPDEEQAEYFPLSALQWEDLGGGLGQGVRVRFEQDPWGIT